jgi:hypothetical protein
MDGWAVGRVAMEKPDGAALDDAKRHRRGSETSAASMVR